ncbi:MAG: FAD-dependent oxidoreductase [Chloroflexota bacterium]
MAENMETKYLIIGNSAGGVGGASGIREFDDKGRLVMVSGEAHPAYSRPLIAEHLAAGCSLERMLYRAPDFYEKNKIETIYRRVEKLDTAGKAALLDDGTRISWEKLLLAVGGLPIVPKTPGMELKGVFTFMTLEDARSISSYLTDGRVVVIGGGLIGMSVSEALVKRGAQVSVVELKDYILNTILDAEAGALAANAVIEAGVELITGHTVAAVNGDSDAKVTGVTLDDKRYIPCHMVIMAIGVRPNLQLANGTGIKVNRGILVDRHMATSIPGIYACGDCAEAYDFVTGSDRLTPIWPNAHIGGMVAGRNMAGAVTEYAGGTVMNSLEYFGLEMVTAGLPFPPDSSYEVLKGADSGVYRKLILKGGKIIGLIFAGNIEKSGVVFSLMRDRVDVSNFKKLLVESELNLAALPREIWQAKLKVPAAQKS